LPSQSAQGSFQIRLAPIGDDLPCRTSLSESSFYFPFAFSPSSTSRRMASGPLGLVHPVPVRRSQSRPLPAIRGSPIAAARRAPLQVLQRENRLPDLAPERRLIAAKPFENSVIEVGQTKKAVRKLASIRIAAGLEDFDYLAHFSGERRIGCGACFALDLEQAGLDRGRTPQSP